jgi:hypothetical protein
LFKEAGCGNSIARLREGVYSFATVLRAHSRNVPSMVLAQLFTRHPASVGETYLQHLCTAATFGLHRAVVSTDGAESHGAATGVAAR